VTPDASSGLIRRLEVGALVWCGLAMAGVLVVAPARTDVLLGVAGGGLLSMASFFAIRASVDAFLRAAARPAPIRIAVKLTGRYALLALLAYVIIARLRLHPLGLLLGMTALAASATAEAVRSLGRPGRLS
jgi:hypothetical protein